MKKIYVCLLLFGLVIAVGFQCKKKCYDPSNPDCENYDPCYGKKPTRADFKILEVGDDVVTPRYAFAYETDTIIGGYATFSAQAAAENLDYRWEIGQGVYTGKNVTLDFNSVPNGTTIPVKLVVKSRWVDKTCFPLDSGTDSIVKNMHVRYHCLVTSVVDTFTYRGHHLDSPNEVLDVKLYYNSTATKVIFENLIREQKIVRTDMHSIHYRLLCFTIGSQMTLQGSAFINKNDSISINYDYSFLSMEPKQTLRRVFVGKKIN